MTSTGQSRIDVTALIEEGTSLLEEDMRRCPSFDPKRPYDEKNAYFQRVMKLGDSLFHRRLHWVAEIYFKVMLEEIQAYESTSGKHFNKGMVHACLGIAQVAVGKLGSGIAHLLTADWEDREVAQPGHSILDTRLWQQFETPYIWNYLISLNSNPDAALSFTVDEVFLDGLFTGMSKQDRIFLEGTIWVLRDNLKQNDVCSNAYTRGQLYSGLKSLCLLTESLLRKRQISDKTISPSDRILLSDDRRRNRPGLLSNALRRAGIGYPQQGLATGADSAQEFVDNLDDIFANAMSPEIRRVYCMHLVRNFTGHHFDPSDTATSAVTGRTFFDMYETVLVNVLSAILWFKHINAI